MSILIAGDLAPIREYKSHFSKGNIEFIDTKIIKEIDDSELFVVNLEAPLYSSKTKKNSAIPNLISSEEAVLGIKKLGVDVCCLANNHCMDSGVKGFEATIKSLEVNGIEHFGAGVNIKEANRLLIKKVNRKKIGFYGISNNEFSVATSEYSGANPEDLVTWYNDIPKYKSQVDFLIIFYHTGVNKSMIPTPNMQRKTRMLIDLGADLIICQHSHIIGAFEKYGNGEIWYGQGDFIFDYGVTIHDKRKYGSLLKIDILNNELKIKCHYFKKVNLSLVSLPQEERDEIINLINSLSEKIKDPKYVYSEYEQLINKNRFSYYNILLSFGHRNMLRLLNKINGSKILFTKEFKKSLLNIIQNDIHRDIFKQNLRNELDE